MSLRIFLIWVVITYQCRLARSQRNLALAFPSFFDQSLQGPASQVDLHNLPRKKINAIVQLRSLSELHALVGNLQGLHRGLRVWSLRVDGTREKEKRISVEERPFERVRLKGPRQNH